MRKNLFHAPLFECAAMWTRDFNTTGNLILKLLVQFLIFISFFIYLDFFYLTNLRPDLLARQNFMRTECFVMSKKLATRGKIFHRARADFLINYHANGAQYNRWVSGNGFDMSYTSNTASQEQALTDYENGTNYTCWYDANNAERVMLVQRSRWLPLYSFILPALAWFIAAIYFIGNVWKLQRMMRNSRRSQEQSNHN